MEGLLLVDKPAGITSHDVVDYIRGRSGVRKVGHGGTLDPLATGLLIVMLGRATKLAQEIIRLDKEYVSQMTLGFSTVSGDLAGEIACSAEDQDYLKLSREKIEAVFKQFIGEIEQLPPMFSAVKYQGKRLYKFARKGIEVPRQPRKVRINFLEIIGVDLPRIEFRINCSRGLYIRQLCVDLGDALGYPAHLSSMVRTAVGRFRLDSGLKLGKILSRQDVEKNLIPLQEARRFLRE